MLSIKVLVCELAIRRVNRSRSELIKSVQCISEVARTDDLQSTVKVIDSGE